LKIFLLFILLLILSTGCSTLTTQPTFVSQTVGEQTEVTPLPIKIITPEAISTSSNFNITSPTPRPLSTSTPFLVDYSFAQIRGPSETDGRSVLTAFWSQDGSLIYYALEDYGIPPWFALDISDGNSAKERQLPSAPPILNVPKLPQWGIYDEYQGFISPSGRYRMRVVSKGDKTRKDNETLFIFDTIRQVNYKVVEMDDITLKGGAYWSKQEDKVILGVGPEYGTGIYIYDLTRPGLIETGNILAFQEIYEWAPSPDLKYIALLEGPGNFRIVSLEDKSAIFFPGDRQFQNLRWSGDSNKVYFFYGNPRDYDFNFQFLGSYDVSTKTSEEIIELSRLNEFIKNCSFDVSPDGKQIVFWRSGDIWLFSLRR